MSLLAGAGSPTIFAAAAAIQRGLRLADDLQRRGVAVAAERQILESIGRRLEELPARVPEDVPQQLYFQARWAVRTMALKNPLLDFDRIVFVKRAPGTFPHVSDQHYGWWSRPGGGIFILEGFKSDRPRLRCISEGFARGSFEGPDLSYDGTKLLLAYCKYYPHLAHVKNKSDKEKLPEDAFYHVFEMNVDGSGVRQLTHGRYEDFDPRYLPGGEIVFLSTRKGQFLQCNKFDTSATNRATLPDSYVRCGGDDYRPVPVFTLHAMDAGRGQHAADVGLRELRVDAVGGRRRPHPLRPLGLHRPLQRLLLQPVVDQPRRRQRATDLRELHDAAAVRVRGPGDPGLAEARFSRRRRITRSRAARWCSWTARKERSSRGRSRG